MEIATQRRPLPPRERLEAVFHVEAFRAERRRDDRAARGKGFQDLEARPRFPTEGDDRGGRRTQIGHDRFDLPGDVHVCAAASPFTTCCVAGSIATWPETKMNPFARIA